MRRLPGLLLAVLILALPAAAPAAGPARGIEILQYARTPDAPGAERVRARLAHRLVDLGLKVRTFRRLPMLVVSGSPAQLRAAGRAPEVLYHHRGGRKVEFDLDRSVPLIFGGDPEPSWSAGFDGRGATVAVLDSGIDGTHPDLIGRVKSNVEFPFDGDEFIAGSPALASLALPIECPIACNTDTFGHGTHVAGIVAGDGSVPTDPVKGVAPGADLVGLSISQSGTNVEFYVLAGFDYILSHPELDIRVVNNSWHIPTPEFDPTDPVNQATKMLHDAGITVVFAAGNSGPNPEPAEGQPEGSSDCKDAEDGETTCRITKQSVAPWTISVAAATRVVPGGPGDQHLADFSSRGDPRPHTVKGGLVVTYIPTLTAPGSGIIAATGLSLAMNAATCHAVGDPPRCLDRTPGQHLFYFAANGTSMAAPHVAGAAAALQSAARAKMGRLLTPDEVKSLLSAGATPMPGIDGSYDLCGTDTPGFDNPCGEKIDGTTGKPYEPWQVGAGHLNLKASFAALDVLANPPPAVGVAAKKAKAKTKKAKAKKKKKKAKRRTTSRRCRTKSRRTKRASKAAKRRKAPTRCRRKRR
jgi:serine protease AprX